MNVAELIQKVKGKLINETAELQREIKGGFAADLMSDVLASIQPEAILITGLCNPQVIRTALMADASAVVLVRGKIPPPETVDLALQEGIPLISTPLGMYQVCGQLFTSGLPSYEDDITSRLISPAGD